MDLVENIRDKNRDVGYAKRNEKTRPKLALLGGIILVIGILVINYGTNLGNLEIGFGGVFIFVIGGLVLLFSLGEKNHPDSYNT